MTPWWRGALSWHGAEEEAGRDRPVQHWAATPATWLPCAIIFPTLSATAVNCCVLKREFYLELNERSIDNYHIMIKLVGSPCVHVRMWDENKSKIKVPLLSLCTSFADQMQNSRSSVTAKHSINYPNSQCYTAKGYFQGQGNIFLIHSHLSPCCKHPAVSIFISAEWPVAFHSR